MEEMVLFQAVVIEQVVVGVVQEEQVKLVFRQRKEEMVE